MIPGLVGAAYGLVTGLVAQRWLATRRYRYADEADLPTRHTGWVVVATTLACALVAAGQVTDHPARGVVIVALVPVLVALAAIDIDTQRLPDKLTLPGSAAAVVGMGVAGLVDGRAQTAWLAVVGALALAAFYFANVVLGDLLGSVAAMGLGDVKLALLLGALLAPLSWAHVVVATVLAFLSGGVQALVIVLRKRGGRHSHLAFGPHMVLGALLVLAAPAVFGAVSG